MAPSDWELNVLKFTEGTDKFKVYDKSISHDLKEQLKFLKRKILSRKTEVISMEHLMVT